MMTNINNTAKAQDERVVFYAASFFKIDGVSLTLRGLIGHITKYRGGRALVLTADDPTDKDIAAFVADNNGRADVLRVTGGLVPAPGADYYMGIQLTKEAKAELEEYCPTVVHITNPDLVALWLIQWVLRERNTCAVIATLHTDFVGIVNCYCRVGKTQALWATSAFLRHFYGLCPAVHAPTEFMRLKVEGEMWDTELGVWGRGVDSQLFSPDRRSQDFRRQLGLGPNDVAALWLGRVVREKRPDVWLQAVQKVVRETQERYDDAVASGQDMEALPPRVVGVCVGEGEAMEMLQGASDMICLGWKVGEELARVVASCDVMVAPSEIETFGRVTLEAMSCGLPCVVNSECGDHLVKHGVNGFCVPSGDSEGYAVGLRKLVEGKDLRSKIGSEGRRMALEYGTTKVYDKMLEIYRSSREKQDRPFRDLKLRNRGWAFWDTFGFVVYYVFEIAKLMTAAIAFATQGPDSEVVRLSVKAFRKHFMALGALLGLNSIDQGRTSSSSSSTSTSTSTFTSLGLTASKPFSACAEAGEVIGVVLRTRTSLFRHYAVVFSLLAAIATVGTLAV